MLFKSFDRRQKKYCGVLCKPNKLYTVGNVVSLAKMLFSRHFNKMPIVGSLNLSYSEFLIMKNTRMGVAHSLCVTTLLDRDGRTWAHFVPESLYKT